MMMDEMLRRRSQEDNETIKLSQYITVTISGDDAESIRHLLSHGDKGEAENILTVKYKFSLALAEDVISKLVGT